MKEKTTKSNIKEETRILRKKTQRLEQSRALIKDKSREKAKIIKLHQDRETELKKNRDDWKAKCKVQEKECVNINEKYKEVAALLEMKEVTLREILSEFEELKKKYPSQNLRGKKLVRNHLVMD